MKGTKEAAASELRMQEKRKEFLEKGADVYTKA
jgi:hypothetical protein